MFICRYLDTSLIDVDAQANHIRVTVKKKIFQLALRDEIRISDSTTQRSLATGHLLIVMPKLQFVASHNNQNQNQQNTIDLSMKSRNYKT